MPTVPRSDGRKVFSEPYGNVQRTIGATEETFGGGAANEQIASAATKLNTTMHDRLAEAKKAADKVRVQDAVNQLGIAESDILTEVGKMQGLDAATKAVEYGTTEHKKRVDEIAKNLTPDQQAEFNMHAGRSFVEIYAKSNNHAAIQREEHDKVSTTSRLNMLTNKVAENVDNPKAVAVLKSDIVQTYLDKALRDKRVTPEEIQAGKFNDATVNEDLFKVKNSANIQVAQALIDNGRPDKAKEYLNSVKSDEIDMEKKNELKKHADAAIDKLKQDAKDQIELQYDKTVMEAGALFTQRKLTLGNIESWVRGGQMKPEVAEGIKNALFTKRQLFSDKSKEWVKYAYNKGKNKKGNELITDKGSYFVSKLKSLKNGERAGEVIMDGFKAYADGLIEEKDLAWIVKVADVAREKKKINFMYSEALNESKYGSTSVEAMAERMMENSFKVGYKKDDLILRAGQMYKVIDDSDPFDPGIELVKK